MEIVQQGAQATVEVRQEMPTEVGERGLMRVPGFIVAQIHLHEIDACFDKLSREQTGVAEEVAAIAIEQARIGARNIKGALRGSVPENGKSLAALAVERFRG